MKLNRYYHFAFIVLQTITPSSSIVAKSIKLEQDVFCNIIQGKSAATILYETSDVIVINKREIPPDGVDCLIIPKKHVVNIKDADPTIGAKLFEVAQFLSKQLQGPGEFTIQMNNGATSHQTVFHMHMHFRSPQRWKERFAKMFKVQMTPS